MVEIRPATFMDLAYIAMHMRDWDRKEIFATLGHEQPVDFAELTMRLGGLRYIAYKDHEPVAATGAEEMWPGVWAVWAFGTDRFHEVGLSLTRFIRHTMTPLLVELGCVRAECKTMEGHTEAHRWLETLGVRREAEHPFYGKNGETFYTHAWLLSEAKLKNTKEAA